MALSEHKKMVIRQTRRRFEAQVEQIEQDEIWDLQVRLGLQKQTVEREWEEAAGW